MLSREGKREVKEIDKYDYYVALITVTATEEAGLRYMYNDWKPLFLKGDEQIYFETSFERNGKIHKIITARQSEMGMTAAGVLTMKMISNLTNLESSNPNRLIGSTKNEGNVERLKSLCALRMDDKELEINNKEKIDKYIITKKTRVLLKLKQNPVLVD